MYKVLICLSVISFLSSCSDVKELSVFGEVKKLSEFENTDFLTTLESDFDFEKNQIYSPTVLFCWQEIKDRFQYVAEIDGENLLKLHNSETYQGVLNGGYESSIDVNPSGLVAKASFNKNLLFKDPFDVSRYPIYFDEMETKAFEFEGYNHQAKIGYYNSDEDFAIVLQPADSSHDIILMKTDFSSFQSSKEIYKKFVKNNVKSISGEVAEWKTELLHNDFTKIPFVKFNIETDFEEFRGESVLLNDTMYWVDTVYQRNAFMLNESGAVVESEAEIEMSKSTEAEEEKVTPKKLYFNNDFVVFLRMKEVSGTAHYKGQSYPYFMAFISNDELLVPFK